jgi:hypothetical protein
MTVFLGGVNNDAIQLICGVVQFWQGTRKRVFQDIDNDNFNMDGGIIVSRIIEPDDLRRVKVPIFRRGAK